MTNFKNLRSLFFILTTIAALAAARAESKFKSGDAVDARFDAAKGEVEVTVKPGFHVNEKAPNTLVLIPFNKNIKAKVQQPQRLVFAFNPKTAKPAKVAVAAYICDDSLTVCEKREWDWEVVGGNKSVSIPVPTEVPVAAQQATVPKKLKMKHGFYLEALSHGLGECEKTGKPVLLDFSARWCPGCMRLEKEVWTHPEMKKTLDLYVKVILDADRFENKKAMEDYGVRGIPTVLILNCKGEELERIVDYHERKVLRPLLEKTAKADLPTRAQLEAKAKAGDAGAALELATRASSSYKNDQALEFFAFVPDREKQLGYWTAAVGQAGEQRSRKAGAESDAKYQAALTKAIQAFPEVPTALDWRSELADVQGDQKEEGKKTLQDLVAFCDELIKDPARMKKFNQAEFAGDYLGIEALKIYQAKADALDRLGKTEEAKIAWKEAVAAGDRAGVKDVPSGQFFRFLPVLRKAQEKERITRFFEKYLKRSPKDGELLRRYARFLFDNGDFKRAADLALKSVENSYDDNEILAATLYAKALHKNGQMKEARQFLLRYQVRGDLTARARGEVESSLAQIK